MSMKIGYLPSSPRTAIFLLTPKSHLQKDKFIFSTGNFIMLLPIKSLAHDDLSISKLPHISAPYKQTCLTVLSNNFKLVAGSSTSLSIAAFRPYRALRLLSYMFLFARVNVPEDENIVPNIYRNLCFPGIFLLILHSWYYSKMWPWVQYTLKQNLTFRIASNTLKSSSRYWVLNTPRSFSLLLKVVVLVSNKDTYNWKLPADVSILFHVNLHDIAYIKSSKQSISSYYIHNLLFKNNV